MPTENTNRRPDPSDALVDRFLGDGSPLSIDRLQVAWQRVYADEWPGRRPAPVIHLAAAG